MKTMSLTAAKAVTGLAAMVDERDRQRRTYDPATASLVDAENALTVEVPWGTLREVVQLLRAHGLAPAAEVPR